MAHVGPGAALGQGIRRGWLPFAAGVPAEQRLEGHIITPFPLVIPIPAPARTSRDAAPLGRTPGDQPTRPAVASPAGRPSGRFSNGTIL